MSTELIMESGRHQSADILEACMKDAKTADNNLKLASATSISVLGAVLSNAVIQGAKKDELLAALMANISDEIDLIAAVAKDAQ